MYFSLGFYTLGHAGEDTGFHVNNLLWYYDNKKETLTSIFATPVEAEVTGPYFFPNIRGWSYIQAVAQHPLEDLEDLSCAPCPALTLTFCVSVANFPARLYHLHGAAMFFVFTARAPCAFWAEVFKCQIPLIAVCKLPAFAAAN
jgi:hypothetical protein